MFEQRSFCRKPHGPGFPAPWLTDAQSNDRIAGYISSSILEVPGGALVPALRYIAVLSAGQ